MIKEYNDRLHDFIYRSMSEGIPPLFFWVIFAIITIIFVIVFYKLCIKLYHSAYIRVGIYSLLMLCLIPIFAYASLMMVTVHHIESNADVSQHQHTIKDIDTNDKGGYTLTLENRKKINVKNIVDTHNKSLKNTSEPMSRGDGVTYYESHSPHVILKAVITSQSTDDSESQQQL